MTSLRERVALAGYRLGMAGGTRRLGPLVDAGAFLAGLHSEVVGAFLRRLVRLMAATTAGRTDESLAVASEVMQALTTIDSYPVTILPSVYEALVSGGRYLDAVRLPRRWPARSRRRARDTDPARYAIVEINRAEALHNLGRDRLALEVLARVEPFACIEPPTDTSRLAKEGGRCLRAWVLASMGRANEADAELARLDETALGPRYTAEVEFTHALAALARGHHAVARTRTQAGLAAARRTSSTRNATFLLGAIAFDEGDDARAIAEFERGAAEAYRGQGGAALLACGLACARAGRGADAERWWALAVERDPESQAAGRARKLLQADRDARVRERQLAPGPPRRGPR